MCGVGCGGLVAGLAGSACRLGGLLGGGGEGGVWAVIQAHSLLWHLTSIFVTMVVNMLKLHCIETYLFIYFIEQYVHWQGSMQKSVSLKFL